MFCFRGEQAASHRWQWILIGQIEKPNYNFASLIRQAILILTGFSTTPLRLTSWLGFVMTLFGVGVFVYVLTIYFTQGSLPGFPFLALLVALLNGTELLAMGIFGEYLACVFERSVDRPTYVVREQIGGVGQMNVVIFQPSYIPCAAILRDPPRRFICVL